MKFNIACIQVNPEIGQVTANINKVKHLIHKLTSHPQFTSVDLILLPELAITGYNFASRQHIEPYLEIQNEGPSAQLARTISKDLKCFTVIGYPELYPATNQVFNSALLTSPSGSSVYNYRKTHLYETDEVFGCSENPNQPPFESFDLVLDKEYYLNPSPHKKYTSITTNFGICMDLNPYKFKAPFNAFEMSLKCFLNDAKLILCPMAWLSPLSPSIKEDLSKPTKLAEGQKFTKFFGNDQLIAQNLTPQDQVAPSPETKSFVPSQPDSSTVNYWILRFFPFLKHPMNGLPAKNFKTTVVGCNRVGVEQDVVYGGSSSIWQFDGRQDGNDDIDANNPSVEVLGSLGMGNEGILLREVDLDI